MTRRTGDEASSEADADADADAEAAFFRDPMPLLEVRGREENAAEPACTESSLLDGVQRGPTERSGVENDAGIGCGVVLGCDIGIGIGGDLGFT